MIDVRRQYVTCNRRGYKLLNPAIWEVLEGVKYIGFSHGMGTDFCDPPVYYVDPKQQTQEPIENLPKGSTIEEEPEPVVVKTVEVVKYETDPEVLAELEIYRSYKLQTKWQLEFDWHYGHEVEWNYKSKKKAKDQMEHIKETFAPKLVETIKNIKITKYVIGKEGEKSPPFTSAVIDNKVSKVITINDGTNYTLVSI
jgi:hypothetical protein